MLVTISTFGAQVMVSPHTFPSLFENIGQKQTISSDDLVALRSLVAESSRIDEDTAHTLIELNDQYSGIDGWDTFYVDTISEYIICDLAPIGYVSHENAQWLMDRISKDGVVMRADNIDLLIAILERGMCVPAELSAFALNQVACAIATGKGPLRHGNTIKGAVTSADVGTLSRILMAFGNFGEVAITRAEAEVLLDINDLTSNAENDLAWSDLFVKAVTNLLMAASGYAVPPRTQALNYEPWQNAISDNVSDVLVRMLSNVLSSYRAPAVDDYWEARNTTWVELPENSRLMTYDEASWLASRIGRDGHLHENERQLLTFLSAKVPSIHPVLQELVRKAAA
jgi:hypothetical protein